ncbi:OLC1v1004349C4 [Oldenlandia corymbosa var. corymbosa]|uniref:OLC1v1004349C4 n=1 Tax=Oldenlandia corymbosa var. corymbosa TaxID=529605 RepID=A0AAV1DCR6_OLDCO|nr:OLC1v1004349C4 [Oldenlandia corymbosa var. corymbosa]
MSPRALESRHSIESCTLHLHSWRPFQLPPVTIPKTLDSDSSKPYSSATATATAAGNVFRSKRPCRADRRTSSSFAIESLDMSRLSLFDDDRALSSASAVNKQRDGMRWFARKRRRRGSRSVSGRSSDRSGTHRRRCCSVGASVAYGTCSDFPMVTGGTDSSGELFVNGDSNWSSDVSEAARNNNNGVTRRERDNAASGEKENISSGFGNNGNFDNQGGQGNESGYGSEPGYRGDAEFGYGDEFDEEEDDPRLPFWGEQFGDSISKLERVGENTLQKTHHRCRRKKHDLRMIDALRATSNNALPSPNRAVNIVRRTTSDNDIDAAGILGNDQLTNAVHGGFFYP